MVGIKYDPQPLNGGDINALPDGLYDTGERKVTPQFYDVTQDRMFKDVLVMLAYRVDSKTTEIPTAAWLEGWWFRPDGARVVKVWIPVDPLPRDQVYDWITENVEVKTEGGQKMFRLRERQ